VTGSVFIFVIDLDIYAITRIKNLIHNFDFTDWTSIRQIDGSASFRILPFYYYIITADLSSIHFYLGSGAGTSNVSLSPYLFPHTLEIVSFQGGFLPAFLIDYGFLGFLFFISVFFHETRSLFSFGTIVMFIILLNANFNTQLFWIIFTFMYLDNKISIHENFD
jgi:hypothetical protein